MRFTFRNPETGKLENQTPRYEFLHQHKNILDRREAAKRLRDAVSQILKAGYNPYLDKDEAALVAALGTGEPEAVQQVSEIRKLDVPTANELQSDFLTFVNDDSIWV
ncbi:MAG: hypothetical protein EOO88_53770 [Pedobacter sp.]|nr:MAG: hypothetical protein EOO88_53770 [Pedobacter sp.]